MKSVMFDGITRDLGDVSTRRSFVRLFSGAAAMGAGLVLTQRSESAARGKGHGHAKSQSHGPVRAAGKGKKLTICVNGQTRTIPKKQLANFPGATKGACSTGTAQPATCTSWIISGGPDRTTPISVDDDLQLMVNGVNVLNDTNGAAGNITPVAFAA